MTSIYTFFVRLFWTHLIISDDLTTQWGNINIEMIWTEFRRNRPGSEIKSFGYNNCAVCLTVPPFYTMIFPPQWMLKLASHPYMCAIASRYISPNHYCWYFYFTAVRITITIIITIYYYYHYCYHLHHYFTLTTRKKFPYKTGHDDLMAIMIIKNICPKQCLW